MRTRVSSHSHLYGLGLALLLLVVVALGAYTSWKQYLIAADTTTETRAIINQLKNLLIQLQAAELAQHNFLLTGDPQEMKVYRERRSSINEALGQLNQWRQEYAHHPQLLNDFRSAVLTRLEELENATALKQKGDSSGALAVLNTNRAKATMENVKELERRLEQHEEFILSVTRVRSRSYAHLSQLTSTVGCCGIFVVVLLSAAQIHRLISTRNRLAEKLSQLADDFQHLADSVPQMVWQTSEDGSIEYMNERWIQFSGELAKTNSGESWRSLIHPEDRAFITQWEDSLKKHEPLTADCRMRDHAAGRYHWFLFRATPVRNGALGRLRWFATFTDIDRQKAAEEALQRSNEDLQQFVYSASHDLREPLRTMTTYSQLLARRLGVDQEQRGKREIEILQESAQRMQELLEDLLAYSEVASSESECTQLVDSGQVLSRVLQNLQYTVEATSARITSSNLPVLPISETHLLQLFQNLIGNALKYHKPDAPPEIRIFARQQSSEWIISVEDNGIGIDPAYHTKVFGIFKRLHSSQQYAGTGLGLAICRKIVERHGGRIWVESKPGVGSTFYFSLPAAAVASEERHGIGVETRTG